MGGGTGISIEPKDNVTIELLEGANEVAVDLSCGRIACVVVQGGAPVVLMLHGNSSCKAVFTHQIAFLRAKGATVIAPDFPGHGASANARQPERTYSFPGYAAVIGELLDTLGFGRIDILGWSLGGHVALELMAHDERIQSVMIVGTPPGRPGPEAMAEAFKNSAVMDLAGKREFTPADVVAYGSAMLGGHDRLHPDLLRCLERTDGTARYHMVRNGLAGIGVDQRHLAESSETPLAVVHGAEDPFVRLDYLKSIDFRCLWSGEIIVLDKVGHAPHWERPDMFCPLLWQFLQERGSI